MRILLNFPFVVGKFFGQWLECLKSIENIDNLRNRHETLHISSTNRRYRSIYDASRQYYKEKKFSYFRIQAHHVVLRAKERKILPPLSSDPSSYSGLLAVIVFEIVYNSFCFSGSHLCDSADCLRAEHLEVELHSINASRRFCDGVVLWVINNTITDVNVCPHGTTHPKFKEGGDELEFSCRKLRVVKMFM